MRLLGLLLVLAAIAATAVPGGSPAGAQTDPDVTEIFGELTAVRSQLDSANAQLIRTRDEQAVLRGEIDEVVAEIAALQEKIAVTQAEIDRLVAEREAVLELVRRRAAVLYRLQDPVSPLAALTTDAPMDLARRQVLGQAAARRDEETREALRRASEALAAARDELAAQRQAVEGREADLRGRQQQLNDLDASIRSQQADLDARARALQSRLQAAIAAGVLRAGGPSVMGSTTLSGAQLAAWWRAQGYGGYSVSVSIDVLAQLYVDEGNAEGVRGDLAFAQAVLETAGFRYTRPGNNFAGMGWCDSCSTGRTFPTPRDGVRAQIQHLKNYGDPTSRAASLAHPASVHWYAPSSLDQGVANTNFDTFFAKGWALTWNQMGNGNWATDPGYSRKVLDLYSRMVAYATA